MSDTNSQKVASNDGANTVETKPEMGKAEMAFLMCCIRNASGGNISVNYQAVASELGFSNVRSVTNKLTAIKKKWDLPFGPGARGDAAPKTPKAKKGAEKIDDAGSDNEPASPTVMPVKKRAAPRKMATPRKRQTPVKKDLVETDDEELEDVPEGGIASDDEENDPFNA